MHKNRLLDRVRLSRVLEHVELYLHGNLGPDCSVDATAEYVRVEESIAPVKKGVFANLFKVTWRSYGPLTILG